MNISQFKGSLALFGAAFIYATFGVLIRELAKMFGDNAQVAARFVLALVFISILNIVRKQVGLLPKRALLKVLALGGSFTILVLLFTFSVNNTKIANTVFVFYAGSIVSSLLVGTLIFQEKITLNKILAIFIAFLGLGLYANSALSLSIAIVAGFSAGLFDGVGNGLRKSLKGVSRNLVLQYQYIFGSIFATIIMLLSREQIIRQVSLLPILTVILFALLFIGLGYLLLYGFSHFDVNVGTVILVSELFFASLLGYTFYKEIPSSREAVGGVLIFVASILSTVDPKQLFNRRKQS